MSMHVNAQVYTCGWQGYAAAKGGKLNMENTGGTIQWTSEDFVNVSGVVAVFYSSICIHKSTHAVVTGR